MCLKMSAPPPPCAGASAGSPPDIQETAPSPLCFSAQPSPDTTFPTPPALLSLSPGFLPPLTSPLPDDVEMMKAGLGLVGSSTTEESSGGHDNALRTKHVLPPCKVCGAPAKGFHYGANTCEACKGFFRRSLLKKGEYVCLKDSSRCTIRPGKRGICGYCRYQQCLKMGMSVDAIRIGRYTIDKKNRDIKEVIEHERKKAGFDESPIPVPQTTPELELGSDFTETPQSILKALLAAQDKHCPETRILMQRHKDISRDQQEFKVESAGVNPEETAGDNPDLMKIDTGSGVKVDKKVEVTSKWLTFLDQGLRRHVNYTKDIPGFRSLPMQDQLNLIKNTVIETWIITRHFCLNPRLAVFTAHNENGEKMTFDILKILGKDFGLSVLKVAERLAKLKLTFEEVAVLKPFAMFFPDRCALQARDQVEKMQEKFLAVLEHLLADSHPENPQLTLANIIGVLSELRILGYMCSKKFEDTPLQLVPSNVVPPLIQEVLASSQNELQSGQESAARTHQQAANVHAQTDHSEASNYTCDERQHQGVPSQALTQSKYTQEWGMGEGMQQHPTLQTAGENPPLQCQVLHGQHPVVVNGPHSGPDQDGQSSYTE